MKIVSGGQTGADLAALNFALDYDLPHAGWVPKGKTNEAGRIPDRFDGLTETSSDDVSVRTKLNIESSDATLVFVDGSVSPGTELTIDFTKQAKKPCLVIDVREDIEVCAARVRTWLVSVSVAVLNVAGPRASEAPHIGAHVYEILCQVFSEPGN